MVADLPATTPSSSSVSYVVGDSATTFNFPKMAIDTAVYAEGFDLTHTVTLADDSALPSFIKADVSVDPI